MKSISPTKAKAGRSGRAVQRNYSKVRAAVIPIFWMVISLLLYASCKQEVPVWQKGNVHTHTYWSDGDDFPESAVKWYRENGYNFLVMTDHNIILEGEKWRSFPADHPVLAKYVENFGSDWVETLPGDQEGTVKVRLKALEEFRARYELPGEFLLMMGNEISNPHAVHLVAIQQDRVIPSVQGTADERERMISETVANLAQYRSQTGVNSWPVLAHPNFTWAITAEMILNTPDLRFFEVYNGHPLVNNDGDAYRASTERIWDIVLANRLTSGGEILYGFATDDTHNYHGGGAGPGKGWVMVRSNELNPEMLLGAIDRGDFYASTGVKVRDVRFNGRKISIELEPGEGITYTTEFIGTLRGFDPKSIPTLDGEGNEIENTTRTYSDEIGIVLATDTSLTPSYTFSGEELYVRVRITADKDQVDPVSGKILGRQMAWLQPIVQK
jgi:hypothetical protein